MNAIHEWQDLLDSRQLGTFVTLARTGSFTEAGWKLFLTHFAICHSLKALQNELACRLLNRLGKRIELTAVGEAFCAMLKMAL
jgi:DNA-binding transcriptional LysR family regulator